MLCNNFMPYTYTKSIDTLAYTHLCIYIYTYVRTVTMYIDMYT